MRHITARVELNDLSATHDDGHAHAVRHPRRAGKEGLKSTAKSRSSGLRPSRRFYRRTDRKTAHGSRRLVWLHARAGAPRRGSKLHAVQLDAFVAHGANLGIATMEPSTKNISADVLQHVSRWYLRLETLKDADRTLVNFHHGLELSSVWGDGGASSSDCNDSECSGVRCSQAFTRGTSATTTARIRCTHTS